MKEHGMHKLDPKVRLKSRTVWLSGKDREKIIAIAKREGRTVGEMVREIIRRYQD